jgi:hypothetical protein
MKKKTLGLIEKIEVVGDKTIETMALCDSGARGTSIDIELAANARLGPIIKTTKIKAASISREIRRPVVKAKIKIKGRVFNTEVNIQDRSHMTFPVIIGRNILTGNFIIDTKKGA